jgi:molecular chaperone GrpE
MSKKKSEEKITAQPEKPAGVPEDKPIDLKIENESLKTELSALKDTLQHLQAEFENYRKRCERDNAQFVMHASEGMARSLLPILDNLELALNSKSDKEELHKGLELIYTQLYEMLEDQGLQRMDSIGKKFDPYYHEALLSEENAGEPNIVLEELQAGYQFLDKVIRHSKVKVSKRRNGGN